MITLSLVSAGCTQASVSLSTQLLQLTKLRSSPSPSSPNVWAKSDQEKESALQVGRLKTLDIIRWIFWWAEGLVGGNFAGPGAGVLFWCERIFFCQITKAAYICKKFKENKKWINYTVLVPWIPSNPQQYLLVRVWLFFQTFLIGILHRQIADKIQTSAKEGLQK